MNVREDLYGGSPKIDLLSVNLQEAAEGSFIYNCIQLIYFYIYWQSQLGFLNRDLLYNFCCFISVILFILYCIIYIVYYCFIYIVSLLEFHKGERLLINEINIIQ